MRRRSLCPVFNHQRLTIFYHVVRHGGLAAAARKMPGGLSLNSISRQILLFEEELGARLFSRSPFELTPAGRELFAPLPAMAEVLNRLESNLQSVLEPRFRIGAEDGIRQSLLLPAAVDWLEQEPLTKVEVQSGPGERLLASLAAGELDFVIALSRPSSSAFSPAPSVVSHPSSVVPLLASSLGSPKTATRIFGRRPLRLLVPKGSGITDADHFWRQKRIAERLATPRKEHPIVQSLHAGLRQGALEWPAQIVLDSVTAIPPFVAAGLGMGLVYDLPALTEHPDVRALPVHGFAPVDLACSWILPATPQIQTALRIAERRIGDPDGRKAG